MKLIKVVGKYELMRRLKGLELLVTFISREK